MVKKINGLQWILCHTGSMMFAFATPEEWTFEVSGGKYDIKAHDVLILKDKSVAEAPGYWKRLKSPNNTKMPGEI